MWPLVLALALTTGPSSAAEAAASPEIIPAELKFSVIRNGSQLTLKPRSGKEIVLKDNVVDNDLHVNHELEFYYKDSNAVLIKSSLWEGRTFSIYSLADGSEIVYDGLSAPQLSPDKKHFIVTNADESGFTDDLVIVGSLSKVGVKVLYKTKESTDGAAWEGNDKLSFDLVESKQDGSWVPVKKVRCTLKLEKADCSK